MGFRPGWGHLGQSSPAETPASRMHLRLSRMAEFRRTPAAASFGGLCCSRRHSLGAHQREGYDRATAILILCRKNLPESAKSYAGANGPILPKHLDYRVGRNGEADSVRRSILARVFEGPLPPVFPPDYMASWGRAKSVARLRKLAESLAAFARNAKRRRDSVMDDAISDWEADLSCLYERYYLGRFSFAWPLTRI